MASKFLPWFCFLLALSLGLPAAGFGQANQPEPSLNSFVDELNSLADSWESQNKQIEHLDSLISSLNSELQLQKNLTAEQKSLLEKQRTQLEEQRLAVSEARKHFAGLLKVCENIKLAKQASDLTWQIGIPVSFAMGGVAVWMILKH